MCWSSSRSARAAAQASWARRRAWTVPRRRKIVRTADAWLRTRKRAPLPPCRFDVVAVTGAPDAPENPLAAGAFDA